MDCFVIIVVNAYEVAASAPTSFCVHTALVCLYNRAINPLLLLVDVCA